MGSNNQMKDFTVKELAELVGVSKTTIQIVINSAAISSTREDGQTRYYNVESAAAIISKIKPDYNVLELKQLAEQPTHMAEQTETPPQITATEPKQTETPQQTENIELMREMLKTIQEQLAAKDKQIASYEAQIKAQGEQIIEYSNRLKEAMELTKGQQYIAAADKTAGLIEANTKKGFWGRVFGKR